MASSIATDLRRASVAAAAACVLVATSSRGAAQAPSRQGVAQTLFDEARVHFDRGEWSAACDKFRSSHELDPRGGTLLNLALCREKQGRVASAWTAFAEARNLASKEGRSERVAFAEKKLRELEPSVPKLVVVVEAATQRPDLAIRLDGDELPRAAWNVGVPVDPGPHRVEATASGRVPFSTIAAAALASQVRVVVTPLAESRETGDRARTAPAVATGPARWPGWLLVGAGVAALGVGAGFGAKSFGERGDAEDLCRANRCAEGRALDDQAGRSAWVSNVGIGVGAVALVAGLYLVLRSADQSPRPMP